MAIVIPFKPRQARPRQTEKRSSEEALLDYVETMIAFRSMIVEDEDFDLGCIRPRDIRMMIAPDRGLSDSQEAKLASHLKFIATRWFYNAKIEAILDAWRLYEEGREPSRKAILAAFRLAGARSESGIAKLIDEAKQARKAYLEANGMG
jgi:hypothetical protein